MSGGTGMDFVWRQEYVYGIEQMDSDHRHLLLLAHGLVGAVRAGRPQEELRGLLEEGLEALRGHMTSEEELLRKAGYPGLAIHKREHDEITRALLEYREHVMSGVAKVDESVVEFVYHWFVTHMKHEDRAAAEFLQELAKAS